MKLRVLGCAGGIGGREKFTTCLGVDQDILLDAGTGVTNLTVDEMTAIDHVFLTHCHLDHVAGLAFLVDTALGRREKPLIVHATEQVIAPLKQHLFNWLLWPDFATLPDVENPIMRWDVMPHGAVTEINGRLIVSHPSEHTPGSSAYAVKGGGRGFLFTGDTGPVPALWKEMKADDGIDKVIVDCSFPNADEALAQVSRHFCPRTLINDVRDLPPSKEFLVYHLKPGQEDIIMHELHSAAGGRIFRALRCDETIEF